MKNRNDDTPLEEQIASRYDFDPGRNIGRSFAGILGISSRVMDHSEELYECHEIERREQPDKVEDALDHCKEQMMVRNSHKPEYFIWGLELKEDNEGFGFAKQAKKNRLTKFVIDLSFTKVSKLLKDYFDSKVSIVSTDISSLSKKS
ncbi:MAG: hypothetical protein GF310_05670 [candidate division Zixibacteria bacterium]|nr:hypothetical protein [candidate division Zixibacteria bacterium]